MKHDAITNAEGLLGSTQETLAAHQAKLEAAQAAVAAAQNAVTEAEEALAAAQSLPNDGPSINLRINRDDHDGREWMGPSPGGPVSIYFTHEVTMAGAIVEWKGAPETPWPQEWTPLGTVDPVPYGTRWCITESNMGGRKFLVRIRHARHASTGAFAPDQQLTIDVDLDVPYVAP